MRPAESRQPARTNNNNNNNNNRKENEDRIGRIYRIEHKSNGQDRLMIVAWRASVFIPSILPILSLSFLLLLWWGWSRSTPAVSGNGDVAQTSAWYEIASSRRTVLRPFPSSMSPVVRRRDPRSGTSGNT
jgi:hypothetical protein